MAAVKGIVSGLSPEPMEFNSLTYFRKTETGAYEITNIIVAR